MIKAGVCSVSFKQKAPKEVIELVSKTKLRGIEWIGNTHVPPNDIENAKKVGEMTRTAGLEVASYGSLFRLGANDDVVPYLETACALGAKDIRIWAGAGTKPSFEYTKDERSSLIYEAISICSIARDFGITISTECHDMSLTDCAESQLRFMQEVNQDNFFTYWQEILTLSKEDQDSSLLRIHDSGKLRNIHVYQYKILPEGRERQLIKEGFGKWKKRFDKLKKDTAERYALIEFVKNNSDEAFLDDANTLLELLS